MFTSLIDNAQLSLCRADLAIAKEYSQDRISGETHPIYALIQEEYQRTLQWVLKLIDSPQLLPKMAWFRESVDLRNPYVDPMSFTQAALLNELQNAAENSDESSQDSLHDALLLTINGIAAGLQNTG